MVMEIIAGVAVLLLAILVIFLLLIVKDARKTLKKADRTLNAIHEMTEPSEHLIHNLNRLTLDIKKKSEGVDVFFKPLYTKDREDNSEASQIIEGIGAAIRLFRTIKNR